MSQLALLGGPKAVTLPWPAYPVFGPEEISAVVAVMMSGQLSDVARGPVVAKMEDDFAAYFGVKHALSFNSGTSALHAALFAVGVGPGSEVLTANNTWASAVTAICHAGGTPVFCDTRRGAHYLDPGEIRRKAGLHTKAVIVTHLWGIPADMDAIGKLARQRNLAVIEDCSHAHGGRYKGKLLGTLGDVGAFSLQNSKSIVAGEGGFVITNQTRYYQRAMVPGHHDARLARQLTLKELAGFKNVGGYWKYRIPILAAAIATEQLKKLDALNAARQANFDRLHGRLRKSVRFVKWPALAPKSRRGWYGTPAWYEYDQKKVSRDLFAQACAAEGARINTLGYQNWCTTPLFQDLDLYSELWTVRQANGVEYRPVPPGGLPNNEELRTKSLILPIPAVESFALMDQVAQAFEKVAANMGRLSRSHRKGG